MAGGGVTLVRASALNVVGAPQLLRQPQQGDVHASFLSRVKLLTHFSRCAPQAEYEGRLTWYGERLDEFLSIFGEAEQGSSARANRRSSPPLPAATPSASLAILQS